MCTHGSVQGGFFFHPCDEELSYHPSEQKSLTGDPMSPGTPDGKKPLDIVLSVYSNWRTAVEKQE
jgi:hypothetical protein